MPPSNTRRGRFGKEALERLSRRCASDGAVEPDFGDLTYMRELLPPILYY
jgi:hypothetical protein